MSADRPTTREEAEAAVDELYVRLLEDPNRIDTGRDDEIVYVLARIGIDAAFPTDEVRERVAKAIWRPSNVLGAATTDSGDGWHRRADAALTALSAHEKEET